jgi:hypothetical protein
MTLSPIVGAVEGIRISCQKMTVGLIEWAKFGVTSLSSAPVATYSDGDDAGKRCNLIQTSI